MFSIKDFIARLFGTNKIQVAVIGATSSGKTYLLTDLVTSLYAMGYYPKDDDEGESPHSSITTFIPNVVEMDGIEKTPIYAARPENQYRSVMVNEQLGRSFELDFLDVPGEAITKDSIMEFQAIAKALKKCGSKLYEVTTWRQKGGKGIKRTVRYIHAKHTVDSDEYQSQNGIQLDGAMGAGDSLFGGTGGRVARTQEYMSSAIYIDRLSHGYEKLPKKTRLISGRELFKKFNQFVTDTVMEAIVDSWDVLEVDSHLMGKMSADDMQYGLSMTDSNRDRFDKVYKNHFYFHYYTLAATDVVVCDKMAVPSGVTEGQVTDKFNFMVESLKTLAYMNEAKKINWYMAFRGVDSIICQGYLKSLYSTTDLNTTYSYLLLMLSRKISQQEQTGGGPFSSSKTNVETLHDAYEMWDSVSGLDVDQQIRDTAFEHYQNFEGFNAEYFRSPFDYTILSMTSGDEQSALRQHILNRRNTFMGLTKTTALPDEEIARTLQIPPHVHFTASPIDTHFNIYGHSAGNGAKFEGPVSDPGQRICFGTYELLSDILLAHGKSLPFKATEYGGILDYLYGNN